MNLDVVLLTLFKLAGFAVLTGGLTYIAIGVWDEVWHRYKGVRLTHKFIRENWNFIMEWLAKQEGVKENDWS